LETGRWTEAEQAYTRALALQPRSPETHFNVAQLRLRQGQIDSARQHLLDALRLRPDYPEARAQLYQLAPTLLHPPASPNIVPPR